MLSQKAIIKKFLIFTGVEKNVSPRKWCVSKISSTDNMEENYSSPIQKAWIITPIKELAEPLETVACKKMLNFHSEPKEYINIESRSLSNYIKHFYPLFNVYK